jgi:hypothetical protein
VRPLYSAYYDRINRVFQEKNTTPEVVLKSPAETLGLSVFPFDIKLIKAVPHGDSRTDGRAHGILCGRHAGPETRKSRGFHRTIRSLATQERDIFENTKRKKGRPANAAQYQ